VSSAWRARGGALVLLAAPGCDGCADDEMVDSWAAVPAGEWACAACEGRCVETYTPADGASHVDGDLSYPDEPPSSGDHNGCWASWGVHTEEVAAENWVHNLEHGGVVFLYDCPEGCATEVEQLAAYVSSLPEGRAILSPYAAAEYRFTAVAWEHRLELGCLDLPLFQSFYGEHVGRGPEDVTSEPSSSCM
jgi:hypothetical protein